MGLTIELANAAQVAVEKSMGFSQAFSDGEKV